MYRQRGVRPETLHYDVGGKKVLYQGSPKKIILSEQILPPPNTENATPGKREHENI